MSMKETEIALWNSFRNGDREALSTIFRSHYSFLYQYGYKICGNSQLVEDCIQDLFLYLYETRKTLGDVTYIKSYLFKSYRRRLLKEMQIAKGETVNQSHEKLVVEPQEIYVLPDEDAVRKKIIASMINKLPPRQRELIFLRYYSDLSIDEISETLSISYRSVINTLYKAMIRLRKDQSGLRKIEHLLFPILLILFSI
ncbi:RNA polymerase sigma factor [Membranihabitans maritimus]|uniref:RNA polymerase sigma factor n=1 Tax=Membranihabitans maritimus TaxID=2904244 RepID=UPI001F2B782C|nr:sigma-70 family RNA polymerase sigma factor [Membranihabitans maritimus]